MKIVTILSLVLFGLVALGSIPVDAGWDPNKEKKEMNKAQATISAYKKKDPGMKTFFDKAHGYVVFPKIVKGAVGIGGAHGKGLVFEKGTVIGRASLLQGTVGFQLGGQAYSEIIFFKDKTTLKRLIEGKLEFSAQATAVGLDKGVAANADYNAGVAIFTMAKGGLMYEASIGGKRSLTSPRSNDGRSERMTLPFRRPETR